MKTAPRRLFSLLSALGLAAFAARADTPYPVLRERLDRDILAHPQDYSKRAGRAALILQQGKYAPVAGQDVDTLLAHPEWRAEGQCLQARSLYLQGRLDASKDLIRKNIQASMHARDQALLLADIALSEKDTAAAIDAYRLAWSREQDENDYLDLLNLYPAGRAPEGLLQQGLKLYPRSPGVIETVFEACFAAGDSAGFRKSLEISLRAQDTLWPLSADWRIRHARALLSLGRFREAEEVSLSALDLLNSDARLQGDNGRELRRQIFSLLESSRNPSGAFLDEPLNEDLLARYNQDVRENPSGYKRRWQRTVLLLKHGDAGPPTAEDIDTLLPHPQWHAEARRLMALRLYLLGRFHEARELIRKNIDSSVQQDQEQSRLWAHIELSHKDTAAALAAYRFTWDRYHDENVYLNLLGLHRARGEAPGALLQAGLKLYPRSAGAMQAVFETYFAAGDTASLRKCLEISGPAEKTWWPLSVDWKIRHARVLLMLERREEMGRVLQQALDLMDDNPRLQANTDNSPQLRKEIFALLEASKN